MPGLSILLTGATGYVGGLLLPLLEARDHEVRCLVRSPGRFRRPLGPASEVVQGDSLDAPSLARAMAGIDVAFYLIHSMGGHGAFEDVDREAAFRFGMLRAIAARGARAAPLGDA
jgi:uncharacterized protein YbjT (DUF2867 family)